MNAPVVKMKLSGKKDLYNEIYTNITQVKSWSIIISDKNIIGSAVLLIA